MSLWISPLPALYLSPAPQLRSRCVVLHKHETAPWSNEVCIALFALSLCVPPSHADSDSPMMAGQAKGCLPHKHWAATAAATTPVIPSLHLSLNSVVLLLSPRPLLLSVWAAVVLAHSKLFASHLMTTEYKHLKIWGHSVGQDFCHTTGH